MKKFLLVVLAALAIALGLWFGARVAQANRRLAVAELLPRTTLFFAEVPDFNRSREQWHASDLDALWREPALQTWLQKPLARWRKNRPARPPFDEFLQLGPTDGFVALTSIDGNEPKVIGGFRFKVSQENARQFIARRRAAVMTHDASVRDETISYHEHEIETKRARRFVIASAFDRDWFFAANDLETLEALLDRADRRAPQPGGALRESEIFKAGTRPLPTDYTAMFYFEPRPFVEKLLPLVAMTNQSFVSARLQRLKETESVAGALGFDRGKMRETTFAVRPRLSAGQKLTMPSLGAADTNTFFYSDAIADWSATPQLPAGSAPALPAIVARLSDAFVRQGISRDDLRAAFGDEVESTGNWPPGARWPNVLVSLPVKDSARARKITDALTTATLSDEAWTRTEKDGITFYASPNVGSFISLSFTIALSGKMLIAGSDAGAVEAAASGKLPAANALEKSQDFRDASGSVGKPETVFFYIDPRVIFERADATLRPMLSLAAMFNRSLNSKLNAAQIPPVDTLTKHLSPIVMSQRYGDGGYLSESIGPITFDETIAAVAGSIAALYVNLHKTPDVTSGLFGTLPAAPAPTSSPAASPTPTVP